MKSANLPPSQTSVNARTLLERMIHRLFVVGELAITSSGRVLELLLPRHVSRASEEKIKGDNVLRGTKRRSS
jgi:hypothetical protein